MNLRRALPLREGYTLASPPLWVPFFILLQLTQVARGGNAFVVGGKISTCSWSGQTEAASDANLYDVLGEKSLITKPRSFKADHSLKLFETWLPNFPLLPCELRETRLVAPRPRNFSKAKQLHEIVPSLAFPETSLVCQERFPPLRVTCVSQEFCNVHGVGSGETRSLGCISSCRSSVTLSSSPTLCAPDGLEIVM